VYRLGVLFLIAMEMITAGCGSSSSNGSSGNINGNWSASLTNADGTPAYKFTTTFTQSSNGSVSVTNFNFTSAGPCFSSYPSSDYTETGSFGLTGNFNGQVNGTFGMKITTNFASASNNALSLQGVVAGSTITGTWSATGLSGCTGNGSFTIQPSTAG